MLGAKHKKHECIMTSGGVALLADGEDKVTKWSEMVEGKKVKHKRVSKRFQAQAWYHKTFSFVDYFNKVCIHPIAI